MDFFVGGFGKDSSWCLVSECPFVVQDKKENTFISVETIKEAASYYESDAIYAVFVWNAGVWNEVNFLTTIDKPSKSIGFNPSEKSK
jgi:hypothetical protein